MSYKATMASAGGYDIVLAKSSVIACEGATFNWLSRLPSNSIFSWEPLRTKLLENFQGFSCVFLTSGDLYYCKQKETLTNYFRRFVQLKAQTSDVPNSVVIDAYIRGSGPEPCASQFTQNKQECITYALGCDSTSSRRCQPVVSVDTSCTLRQGQI